MGTEGKTAVGTVGEWAGSEGRWDDEEEEVEEEEEAVPGERCASEELRLHTAGLVCNLAGVGDSWKVLDELGKPAVLAALLAILRGRDYQLRVLPVTPVGFRG